MNRQAGSQNQTFLEQFVRPGLNLAHLQEIKAAFDVFDPNQTGKVKARDIKAAIQGEGPEAVNHPFYQMVCELDQEGKGSIDFEQFLSFLTPTVSGLESREQMKQIFQLFDDQKTGRLSLAGLRRITAMWHLEWQQQDLEELLKQSDANKDGCIDFQDFYGIMSYKATLDLV